MDRAREKVVRSQEGKVRCVHVGDGGRRHTVYPPNVVFWLKTRIDVERRFAFPSAECHDEGARGALCQKRTCAEDARAVQRKHRRACDAERRLGHCREGAVSRAVRERGAGGLRTEKGRAPTRVSVNRERQLEVSEPPGRIERVERVKR